MVLLPVRVWSVDLHLHCALLYFCTEVCKNSGATVESATFELELPEMLTVSISVFSH